MLDLVSRINSITCDAGSILFSPLDVERGQGLSMEVSPRAGPGASPTLPAGPAGCTLQAGQKGPPGLGLLVWLISSHLFARLPGQLHSKQRPGLHAAGSKLGTCPFCLLWGTRREQTAAFVSQVGDILHSITALKGWRDAKVPFQGGCFLPTPSPQLLHWICP